jgi:SAM-dependent methyltransferase
MRINIKVPRKIKVAIKSSYYYLSRLYSKINKSFKPKDSYGRCSVCGNYSGFRYIKVFDENSREVISCNWDEKFTENINITNSMNCGYGFCLSKYRVRCAADVLLKHFWKGKIKSINELVSKINNGKINWKALETASSYGIFSDFDIPDIIKSEYFDDVKPGDYKNNIICEDLQKLTFENNSFDCVIALDVFEHIPDPWIAFAEIKRVLKPGGAGIITVPIDIRNSVTEKLAEIKEGKIQYLTQPAYHSDPLRKDGAPVFTNFGMDIEKILKSKNYNLDFFQYSDKKNNGYQFVILIKK